MRICTHLPNLSRGLHRSLLAALCLNAIGVTSALAAPGDAPAGNDGPLAAKVRSFLMAENAGTGNRISVSLDTPTAQMPACAQPAPFLPGSGLRTVGRVTVGVRCPGDTPATRYVLADVTVYGSYFVASHAIASGDVLQADDIAERQGDITRELNHLPANEQAIVGEQARRRIGKSETIVDNMLTAPDVIDSGQTVKIVSSGPGFSITTHGVALGNAAAGQVVRVRTDNGTALTGKASASGTVVIGP